MVHPGPLRLSGAGARADGRAGMRRLLLRPSSLRGRLLRSLAAMLVPLVAVAATGLVLDVRATRALEKLGQETVEETRQVGAAREAIYGLQSAAILRDRGLPAAAARLASFDRLVDRRLAVLARFDEPRERELARQAASAVRAGRAAEEAGSDAGFHLALARAQRLLGELAEVGLEEVEEESAVLVRAERRQLLALLALLVATSLGALLMARRLSASLQRPLRELRRAARRLGDGDLGHRVEVDGHDELRDVAAAFNRMAERLLTNRRQLVHQAFHDELTGLPNRALLGERAHEALTTANDGPGGLVAALFLDLDDFKGVNDSLGHEAGDELLVGVAARLRMALRPEDTVARLGGDEFAVLLRRLGEPADAVHAAERILLALAPPVPVGGRELHVRASIGVAVAEPGTSSDELLRNADAAMYQVKADGKAGYRAFEPWMHAEAVERLELEDELRGALERGELELHYQPVVDLPSGRVTGTEALVRWLHPQRGLLAPGEFIPLAEATGLIVPLDRWVVDAACVRLRLLEDSGLIDAGFGMSVNVSPGQFHDGGFVNHVEAALARHELAPPRLVVEITETLLMADVEASRRILTELTALGVRVALDDFGTGYSSLGYLRQFPVDILKIDRSFVDGVTDRRGDGRLVAEAIIALGRTLGLLTVAEGVEDADQRRELESLGCERGQGYHFARPLAAEALNLFLAERRSPAPARR